MKTTVHALLETVFSLELYQREVWFLQSDFPVIFNGLAGVLTNRKGGRISGVDRCPPGIQITSSNPSTGNSTNSKVMTSETKSVLEQQVLAEVHDSSSAILIYTVFSNSAHNYSGLSVDTSTHTQFCKSTVRCLERKISLFPWATIPQMLVISSIFCFSCQEGAFLTLNWLHPILFFLILPLVVYLFFPEHTHCTHYCNDLMAFKFLQPPSVCFQFLCCNIQHNCTVGGGGKKDTLCLSLLQKSDF